MKPTGTLPSRRLAWDRDTLRDPHAQQDKSARVRAMFDAIAPTYERINRVVSLGRDAGWRQRAISSAALQADDVVLDVCCGTGDMIRTFAAQVPPPKLIIGVDFASRMLAYGHYENLQTSVQLVRADGQRLPLADETIDVISCAFGVRNFQDLPTGLREMYRVLRSGGRVVILEFALPENPLLRWGYRIYSEKVLPRLAALFSRDKTGAYRYLPSSIRTFEPCGAMTEQLERVGFERVTAKPLNFGGVVVYRGEKTRD
jgi:demethylmenaquinone methyltransferase/2-methoxy-6-polyprenyl-1,4-benzoquinol methylase